MARFSWLKIKRILRPIIDTIMLILLVGLFGYNIIGGFAHELIGITIFTVFIIHNLLNLSWYKSLFKGKYKAYRIVHVGINGLLLLCIIVTMITGIVISESIFKLNIRIDVSIYNIHKAMGYYALILSSLHLGMHLDKFITKINNNVIKIIILMCMVGLFTLSIYSFIDLDLYEYLIFKAGFRFYENEPIKYYLKIISFIFGIASLGCVLSKTLKGGTKCLKK